MVWHADFFGDSFSKAVALPAVEFFQLLRKLATQALYITILDVRSKERADMIVVPCALY